jgi:non-heme chloroperoxidase
MSQLRLLLSCVLLAAVSGQAAADPASALIKLPSGVTLHYAVQGRADGEPLVLLHGIGDSWHSYELVLPHFPDRFRVVAVSMRGHGWSDAPAAGYTQAEFAGDVIGLLDALDLRRVTLVGHSLGSFVAQAVAIRDRGRVARLVLIGSGPGGVKSETVRAEVGQLFSGVKPPIDPVFARDFQSSTISGPVPAPFLETMFGEILRSAPQMWSQAVAAVYDAGTAAALTKLRIPALLLWGDRDAMLGRADQDALVNALPKARLEIYEGTGHAPHWEQPERVARDIIAFAAAR